MNSKQLQKSLLNIGPKCAHHLIEAGIDTPEKLKKLGAEKAYLTLLQKGILKGPPHAAYLYALWGAIHECPWQLVPEEIKNHFKKITKKKRENEL